MHLFFCWRSVILYLPGSCGFHKSFGDLRRALCSSLHCLCLCVCCFFVMHLFLLELSLGPNAKRVFSALINTCATCKHNSRCCVRFLLHRITKVCMQTCVDADTHTRTHAQCAQSGVRFHDACTHLLAGVHSNCSY